jgi:hypothetical protein
MGPRVHTDAPCSVVGVGKHGLGRVQDRHQVPVLGQRDRVPAVAAADVEHAQRGVAELLSQVLV